MHAACGGERRKKGFGWGLPAPQAGSPRPRQETAPPAPPLHAACGGERRKMGCSGDTWGGAPQTPAGGLRPPALPALELTQRFSTTNVATAEPVPAVTFNRASAERRERQPST